MGEAMTSQEPTSLLVEKARAGDRRAFEALVERYRERLHRQIEARMGSGVRVKFTANDVLQETIVCALQSIGTLSWQGEESFYSWLGSIAEHVISNVARKRSWKHLEIKRDLPASTPSPSKHLRRQERFDRLQRALGRLSPDHREALLLSRVEGLKVEEIARRMNRTPNAVYKLLTRALIELRRNFGDTESLSLPDRTFEFEEPPHDG
jgi:RNA polymerase sigma-70 factor (ECF subfamily)